MANRTRMDKSENTEDKLLWHPARAVSADYSRRSNLALAFLSLPHEKRRDMDVFYTFCRLVDDIADNPSLPPEEKAELLQAWKDAIKQASSPGVGGILLLIEQIHGLVAKYRLPPEYLLEIIAGVEMDVHGRQYATFEQLRAYCYRVASVVGLVSIEIFGYQDEGCRQYAVMLGLALQLTNIIRDVGVDLDNAGRVYLPTEDLDRFGYTPADLRARVYDKRFRMLMDFEAKRAEDYYREAVAALPDRDRRSMQAAEAMRAIYWRLLTKIRKSRFDVLKRRQRLNTPHKLAILLFAMLQSRRA